MVTNKTPAPNTGLAKVAVQCSADTFVVNQSLVLRINIITESRHLRQARNRDVPLYLNSNDNLSPNNFKCHIATVTLHYS